MLVRQGLPGGELHWSLPGGVVEEGELIREGLTREVREETGLEVLDASSLAFVLQVDNLRAEPLREGRDAAIGYLATIWTLEVDAWQGELALHDPDGVVAEARLVPLDEASAFLEAVRWHELTVRYLRGEIGRGSLHLRRWHADGRVEAL